MSNQTGLVVGECVQFVGHHLKSLQGKQGEILDLFFSFSGHQHFVKVRFPITENGAIHFEGWFVSTELKKVDKHNESG